MNRTVKPATIEEQHVVSSLLQPYLDELSSFPDEYPDYKDENGIYDYPHLDAYWQEDERYPYLLYSNSTIAGFALVRRNDEHWEMAEFYVLPDFRRCGLGTACAREIFEKHTGEWEIGFNKHNEASRSLWQRLAEHLSKSSILSGELDTSHDYVHFST